MTNLTPGNATFYWTTTFFRSLQGLGVKHVVISPGSRSTPLTLAAAANEHFKKHIILDERSAAFTALGISKATNIPAVLICTSGTALANYYPAVIEARQSGIPIILATADRPPYLRATGANQATDQLKIFGDYPVFHHEVGEPRMDDKDLSRLEMLARQAFSAAREKRGSAHLNFPFRKPLEPESDFLEQIAEENKEIEINGKSELISITAFRGGLSDAISGAEKPVIIVGPTAPADDQSSIQKISEQLHCPILSESTIQSPNAISGFAGFLRNNSLQNKLAPDLILRFGFQPTSKSLELALQSWKSANHFHFASTDAWQDATFSGAQHIPWMGKPFEVEIETPSTSPKKGWLTYWKQAEQDFRTRSQNALAKQSGLTDGSIYQKLTPQITEDQFVMVSNSFPARDIHLFGQLNPKIPLFLNRGVSGIDGITSTAIGLSLGLQKAGVLFTGDLAFLHDTNALLNHRLVHQAFTIFVINNDGGSIFRMLPVEQYEKYFRPYFETPQSAHIERLVNAYDIPYQLIDSQISLHDFDLANWQQQHSGLSVIECRTDADASMQLRKKLWEF